MIFRNISNLSVLGGGVEVKDARFDQEASKALLCLEPVVYLKPG